MENSKTRSRIEVADIIRADGDEYLAAHNASFEQRKVIRRIVQCRTAELGGHVDRCDRCGHLRVSYNSCRDRHCPKCQGIKRAEWLHARCDRLLPVPYFHVVFTLPAELKPLFRCNMRLAVSLLFNAAAATLKQIARDAEHLGADIGFTAVLHTWGQNLQFHPHLHCVVTGGGLSPDGTKWIPARKRYFLPVKVLAKLFRGKFLSALSMYRRNDNLVFEGDAEPLSQTRPWQQLMDDLYKKNWVVYAKPPFGGPEAVFRYLGRYTHRIAISNARLTAFQDGRVTFMVRDYTKTGRKKPMTLYAVEFIRRFLLHVLPKNLVRIRHFGLLAPVNVEKKYDTARRLLDPGHRTRSDNAPPLKSLPWWERLRVLMHFDIMACPCCKSGRMHPWTGDLRTLTPPPDT